MMRFDHQVCPDKLHLSHYPNFKDIPEVLELSAKTVNSVFESPILT